MDRMESNLFAPEQAVGQESGLETAPQFAYTVQFGSKNQAPNPAGWNRTPDLPQDGED